MVSHRALYLVHLLLVVNQQLIMFALLVNLCCPFVAIYLQELMKSVL